MPSVAVVFVLFMIIALTQLPVYYVIKSGFVSAGVLLSEVVILAGLSLFVVCFFGYDAKSVFPFYCRSFRIFIVIFFLSIGVIVLVDYLTFISERFFPPPENVAEMLKRLTYIKTVPEGIWKVFLYCMLPAFCEELFFRGFAQTSLERRFGVIKAILITAIMFAVLHGNIWHLHLYFILGIFFGAVYAATGTLWVPIMCHFMNNFWAFSGRLLQIKLPVGDKFGCIDFLIVTSCILLIAATIFILNIVIRSEKSSNTPADSYFA